MRLENDGQVLLFVADLLYQPENVEEKDWVSPHDYNVAKVVETRRAVLTEAADAGTLLMATHLPFPGLGRVRAHGEAWKWFPDQTAHSA